MCETYFPDKVPLVLSEGENAECKRLLSVGADVNSQDDLGWTPLMHAVRYGHCQLARDLIACGALVCALNHHGVTVFTLAVLRSDEALLGLLYNLLTPDLKETESNYALQVACVQGILSAVRWLLRNTLAQINLRSIITGITPLQLAVIGGHHKVVELLLTFGADINILNDFGHDMFELAMASGNRKLLNVLHQHTSPTQVPCIDFTLTKPYKYIEPIDPHYVSNNIYLDLQGEIVLKNSPGRPVFKTCVEDFSLDPKSDEELKAMLSPSLKSVFLPSPKRNSTPISQSWDSTILHCNNSLNGLLSPRYDPLTSHTKSPVKSPNRGKKRKLSNKTSCSSWLKRLTKRRTRSLEDSDDCNDFDSSKQSMIDFSQLLTNLELDDFYPIFKEQELDIWTFLTLTSEDLNAMGIHNKSSQARIMKGVDLLRKTQI